MSNRKTVWVLGAGFSRSLGGPLLDDFFRESSRGVLIRRFSAINGDVMAQWAYEMYESVGRKLTGNAESFLVFLGDSIADTNNLHRYHEIDTHLIWKIRRILSDGSRRSPKRTGRQLVEHAISDLPSCFRWIADEVRATSMEYDHSGLTQLVDSIAIQSREVHKQVLDGARRSIAAECLAFFEKSDLDSERFSPYGRWLDSLDSNDAVISFNYDLVLDWWREQNPESRICIEKSESNQAGCGRVYKLHGSVNWRIRNGSLTAIPCADAYDLESNNESIAIGIPGRSKGDIEKTLEHSWAAAAFDLQDAERIAFVGYRMPESDVSSVRFFQDAIRKNKSQNLKVHIVLGSRHALSPDAARLREMLAAFTRHAGSDVVSVLPLNAEDYLAVAHTLLD